MLSSQYERKRKRAEGCAQRSADISPSSSAIVNKAPDLGSETKKPKWKVADIPTSLYGRLDGFLELEELEGGEVDLNLGPNLIKTAKTAHSGNNETSQESSIQLQDSNADFHKFDEDEASASQSANKKTQKRKQRQKQKQNQLTINDAQIEAHESSLDELEHRSSSKSNTIAVMNDIPEYVSLPAWEEFALSEGLINGLSKLKFAQPTAIQKLVMPHIIAGRDVIGKASTGSGKTLAFGLPILDHICSSRGGEQSTMALIMAPTRELAQQIAQHLIAVSSYTGVRVVTLTGGLAAEKQLRLLRQLPDIIVATPGRLWDLMSSNSALVGQIAKVRFVVLDEADRLLQKGHFAEITNIFETLEQSVTRQTLVFSATFAEDLHHKLKKGSMQFANQSSNNEQSLQTLLSNLHFKEAPLFFDANPDAQVVTTVRQSLIETAPMDKDYLLYYLLLRYPARTLVFTNSISDVHRLTRMLSLVAISALGLHSNKQQKARLKSLERFKADDKAVLVASDVAARGLDIPLVDTVIHYHLPRSADLYIHRSGRTARAEARGLSIVLCSPEERPILKKLQTKLDVREFSDFPVDNNYVGQIKPRINITRQILKLEDTLHRESGAQDSWLAEAAADLGVDVIDEDASRNVKQAKMQISALRKDLAQVVRSSLKKDMSGKYLTRGGASLASRLLSGKTNEHFIGERLEKPSEHYA